MTDVDRGPLAYRLLPRRVFYGWYIAIACSVFMFVAIGVGYYALAVFLGPLEDVRGFSPTQVSLASGLYFALWGLSGAISGPLVDRHGPKRFIAVGSIVVALGVLLIGQVTEFWQLLIAYAILASGFGAATAVPVTALMTRWFVGQRAKATSVATTGISVGGVVLSPLSNVLIEAHGIARAAAILATLVALVAVPLALAVVVTDPADLGLQPDGGRPIPQTSGALDTETQYRQWTRGEALRTMPLWAIIGSFSIVLAGQTGFIIHQVSFLEDRLGSRSAATLALSTTAAGSIVARLAVGQFADRLDLRRLCVGLFCVQGFAVAACVFVDGPIPTYTLTLLFGCTIGNVYMVQSLIIGEVFGAVSFGMVFGLVGLTTQITSGLGPVVVGLMKDQSGSYTLPFLVTAALTAAASFIVLFAQPQPKKTSAISTSS